LTKLRDNLVFIAFLLEPAVEDLMIEYKENDAAKYANEHEQCEVYFESVVYQDKEKFEHHYEEWK
jgi:hypothetical protein